jgi:hypothetical protein
MINRNLVNKSRVSIVAGGGETVLSRSAPVP